MEGIPSDVSADTCVGCVFQFEVQALPQSGAHIINDGTCDDYFAEPMTFHYVVIEKTASHEKPSLKHIVTKRDAKDYEMFENIMKEFDRSADRLNQYKDGIFFPEPTMGFGRFCSKLCSFKVKCWNDNFVKEVDDDV